ncbi:MAG: acyl-CoA dehydrogenase family protein [Actinomycetota bacterium]|nr:acyl-CoA dehydrogenase family protein [Actinomycetota bacterium]
MNIYSDGEHEMFRTEYRRFVRQEIMPIAAKVDEVGEFPLEVLRELGRMGYLCIQLPEQYGGSGADAMMLVIAAEEMAYASSGIDASLLVHSIIAVNPIFRFGSAEQREQYLPRAASGRAVAAIAMTEPDAGSDVASIRTSARRDGDGYVINGTKMFITNGTIADFVVVAARTGEPGHRGISLFIVDAGTPGFRATRRLEKLGWRASDTAELVFDDCTVPADSLIGEEGRGFYYLMENLNLERIVMAADCLGLARAAIDQAKSYALERRQFGRAIASFQEIRFMIVDMEARLRAAELLTYDAAWKLQMGGDCTMEASMARYVAGEMVNRVTGDAIQIHGGYGFMMESDVQRFYRDARVMTIGGGTSQIQKEVIARKLGLG